ncbi:hypothetical protein AC1031_002035 [Aphanomyces cochlioides]|nr:hypothetical protein AC1031_002035 [Aphanomyces cochlioides]
MADLAMEDSAGMVTPLQSPHEHAPLRRSPYTIPQTPENVRPHRVSPYPQRVRTPASHDSANTPLPRPQRLVQGPRRQDQPYQLLVKPLVKSTVGQRDSSSLSLDAFVASGRSFSRAVKIDAVWSLQEMDFGEWKSSMQFKINKKVVDASKSEHEWNGWLVKMKDKTVTLVIYIYGAALGRQQDLDEFHVACIQPLQTDRSGATAEASLRDVITSLQTQWGASFQAEQVVWRMWANHITRNLNRSTWDAAITRHPPPHIAQLFQPVASHLRQHVENLTRSANMALDCVAASMADLQQLRRYLDICESNLTGRKAVVEAFIRDIPPPPAHSVIDPLPHMENVHDTEHQDVEQE